MQTDKLLESKVLVQDQEHVNMLDGVQLPPLSPPDGITDFLLRVWKRKLYACAVQRAHVSKHVDNVCTYRYHHCVSQY